MESQGYQSFLYGRSVELTASLSLLALVEDEELEMTVPIDENIDKQRYYTLPVEFCIGN